MCEHCPADASHAPDDDHAHQDGSHQAGPEVVDPELAVHLVGHGVRKQRKTLNQIGLDLQLSTERVRQVELTGLQKLRQCLSSEEFELLTE